MPADPPPTPSRIVQIGMGFRAAKTLLSAVELELFTVLGEGGMDAPTLRERLGLHPRGLLDFLDALVALGFLARDGDGPGAVYRNTAEAGRFLDKGSPDYMGGILEMANSRLYESWGRLTDALRTGAPQSALAGEGDGDRPFDALYADPARLEEFLRAMQGAQVANFEALVERVDLSPYTTLCDVGGANGALCITLARHFGHLSCTTFDLPVVQPIAERQVAAAGLSDRVEAVAGDFFEDDFPRADVITMGNILHDWDEAQKKHLIRKAHAAVHDGGRFIAIENIIDDARRENASGLLASLNMLVELPGGFDYTGAQFDAWCREAGFTRTEIVPLAGSASAAIAHR